MIEGEGRPSENVLGSSILRPPEVMSKGCLPSVPGVLRRQCWEGGLIRPFLHELQCEGDLLLAVPLIGGIASLSEVHLGSLPRPVF